MLLLNAAELLRGVARLKLEKISLNASDFT